MVCKTFINGMLYVKLIIEMIGRHLMAKLLSDAAAVPLLLLVVLVAFATVDHDDVLLRCGPVRCVVK